MILIIYIENINCDLILKYLLIIPFSSKDKLKEKFKKQISVKF